MSYDFTMFALEPSADLHIVLSAREQTSGPNLFNSESRQRSQAIANALRFKNPQLDWRPIAIANRESIQVDGGENGDGIQVSLRPNEAGVTVPYWHTAQRAYEVFRQIWDYLKIIQQMNAFVIYDPQLDRIIDLEIDFNSVLSTYLGVMEKIDEISPLIENPVTGVHVRLSHSRLSAHATDSISMILFHNPSIGLSQASAILKEHALTVEDKDDTLQVRWNNSPVLTIRLARGTSVKEMAVEIGRDSPYATDLAECDACFGIFFVDLEEVLDEINTLIATQIALQSATHGFLFNTWNSHLSPPNQ
jgi:hypothetical protein